MSMKKRVFIVTTNNAAKLNESKKKEIKRVIHLTESRWPNEYDRNRWTWPKNWQQQTLIFEHDQKFNKYYHNNEQ